MTEVMIPPEALEESLKKEWVFLKRETQYFLTKTINYPQMQEALEAINDTHAMAGVVGSGMLLMGDPGVGKSTILSKYVSNHQSCRDDLDSNILTKWPIIKISIPSRVTPISLLEEILYEVKHIQPLGRQSALEKRLLTFIQEQKVELIIFDEFQHLLRDQAQVSTRNVLNLIKLLMDRCKLAVVMAGIPAGYDAISQHEEIYQRFTHEQVHMQPFDINTDESYASFSHYLRTCEHILADVSVKTIELSKDTMLRRIHLATDGKVRLISRLIVKALEKTDLSYRLVLADYEKAYARMRLNPALGVFNPFTASRSAVINKAEELRKKRNSKGEKS